MITVLFLFLLFIQNLDVCTCFVIEQRGIITTTTPRLFYYAGSSSITWKKRSVTKITIRNVATCCWSSSSRNDGSDNTNDDLFMKSLRSRIQEVKDRDTKIPIVVLDTMLPRQVLKLEVTLDSDNVLYKLLTRVIQSENPTFGMIGMARVNTGQTIPLQNGVEVEVILPNNDEDDPIIVKQQKQTSSLADETIAALRVQLRATRRFRIIGELSISSNGGWAEGRVTYLDSSIEAQLEQAGPNPWSLAQAVSRSRELTSPNMNMPNGQSLVQRWIELAKTKEHFVGQIDNILHDIGPIPSHDEPSERAYWIGSLINPLPGMGVAYEIRPLLLMAKTAEERIGIALTAILASIRHMDGTKRLF